MNVWVIVGYAVNRLYHVINDMGWLCRTLRGIASSKNGILIYIMYNHVVKRLHRLKCNDLSTQQWFCKLGPASCDWWIRSFWVHWVYRNNLCCNLTWLGWYQILDLQVWHTIIRMTDRIQSLDWVLNWAYIIDVGVAMDLGGQCCSIL